MSAEVQIQMRRNIEQANEAIEGLGDWLNEVGKKDANLRGHAAPTGSGRDAGGGDETDEEEEAREIEAAKEELRKLSAEQDLKDAWVPWPFT